jgi:hypothetical protein
MRVILLRNVAYVFNTNYPWVKGIQVCSNKRGDNHKNEKMVGSFKNLTHKNYEAREAEFYMKAF